MFVKYLFLSYFYKFNTATIINTCAQILLLGKKVFLYSEMLFSVAISVLAKILKGRPPALLRDHLPSGDLPMARIQHTVLLELN
jgi:hypothetical protein